MSTDSSGDSARPYSSVRWLIAPVSGRGGQASPTGPSVGPEGGGADTQIKRGARIGGLSPDVRAVYPQIVEAWRSTGGPTPVITSGNDSKHMRGSRHYDDQAIDIRCNNIPDEHCEKITDGLRRSIGPDFDVQFEKFPKAPARDHVHIEYDPKPKPKTPAAAPGAALNPPDQLAIKDWMRARDQLTGRG